MTSLLWILIAIQVVMGAFDTFYHHELTERLAWRPSQRYELMLHSLRNMLYALLFLVLGWLEVHGVLAMLIIAVLAAEIVITLMDFVEEDMSRKLPASERINHTLLAINYGAILVLLLPVLFDWAAQPTGIKSAYTGSLSLIAAAAAVGAALFGLRDFAAARRLARMTCTPAAGLLEKLPARKLPARQTVLVTGATGFIGSRLVAALGGAGTSAGAATASGSIQALAWATGAAAGVATTAAVRYATGELAGHLGAGEQFLGVLRRIGVTRTDEADADAMHLEFHPQGLGECPHREF